MLPYLFDEPAEHVIEKSFETLCRYVGGEEAVQSAHKEAAETPSKILDQKRHEAAPSWEERDSKRQQVTSGWFGFGRKDKEE